MRDDEVAEAGAGGWPTGRIGSWHTYRWSWWAAAAVLALAVPWPVVPDAQRPQLMAGIAVVSLVWAVPVWRCGAIADGRGVRCAGVLWTRRHRWEDIVDADVGWHDLEPRLLIELADDVVVVPGVRMPKHQAYRRDLWRDSRMFAAAELISAEAERRRAAALPPGHPIHVRGAAFRPRRGMTAPLTSG